MNDFAFSKLPLSSSMLSNLDSIGYSSMTPIQAESLPGILEGRDIIAQAKTGSGKTAAFGIGLLEKLDVKRYRIQSLVLCPTRELAEQVANELRRLARFTHNIKILLLTGGVPLRPERESLRHGAHIIVGTPGRVQDHLGKGSLKLDDVNMLVLDEADRMLDMGFHDAIMKIISNIPAKPQTLLFSATFPDNITTLSKTIQNEPLQIAVESTHSHDVIEQLVYRCHEEEKDELLERIIMMHVADSAIIFCNTKLDADEVAYRLQQDGFSALALHGDLDQRDRNEMLVRFSNRSCNILVATDMAARGLDIDTVGTVINYDLPLDPEVYVHRIGRTGRAGKTGKAISLVTSKQQAALKRIEAYTDSEITQGDDASLSGEIVHQREAPMRTLLIFGGKKHKLRPGDIVGALTGEAGIAYEKIGKIDRFDLVTFVAIGSDVAKHALRRLSDGKIKGKKIKTVMIG